MGYSSSKGSSYSSSKGGSYSSSSRSSNSSSKKSSYSSSKGSSYSSSKGGSYSSSKGSSYSSSATSTVPSKKSSPRQTKSTTVFNKEMLIKELKRIKLITVKSVLEEYLNMCESTDALSNAYGKVYNEYIHLIDRMLKDNSEIDEEALDLLLEVIAKNVDNSLSTLLASAIPDDFDKRL